MPKKSEIRPKKLLKSLSLLDKSERTAFRKFLSSPFFHQQSAPRLLFDHIAQFLPIFPKSIPPEVASELEKIRLKVPLVFQKIYPDEVDKKSAAQQKTKVYNLCSDLQSAFEKFVVYNRFQQDPIRSCQHLAAFALSKSSESLWHSAMHKFETALKEQKDSLERWHYRYLYLKMEFESPFFNRLHQHYASGKLEEVFRTQDVLQLLTRAAQACEFIYRAEVMKEKIPESFSEKLLKKLLRETADLAHASYPLLHVYRELILLKKMDGSSEQFYEVFQRVQSYRDQIQVSELNTLVRFLLNYCTSKSNSGAAAFLSQRLAVEKWAIEEGILLIDGLIPDGVFLNACLNAIALDQFDLARDYLRRHSRKLEAALRPSAVALVKAHLFFYQNNYRAANRELKKIVVQGHNYSIRKHLLSIRTTFLLFQEAPASLAEKMYTTLDSYQRFFTRNTYNLPKDRIKRYLNLGSLILKMVDFHANPHRKNRRQLEKIRSASEKRPLALSKWANAIVKELLEEYRDQTP